MNQKIKRLIMSLDFINIFISEFFCLEKGGGELTDITAASRPLEITIRYRC